VLDTLANKQYFSFLDGFNGYNQISIAPKDQDKTTFTCPYYTYKVFPFGICNAPTTFQRVVLSIFSDLIHECVEVYMDDFFVYAIWSYFSQSIREPRKGFDIMPRD